MSFFQVTPRELRNRAGRISELNSQFRAKETELAEQESALCGMWEGGAKDAFHQAFTRDRQQMDAFHQLISQYVQALLEIAARYEQAEARNREIASARNY